VTLDKPDRTTFNPQVMGGRATIRGMRVTVSLILNLVANGMPAEDILIAYPYLEAEDIRQALQYGGPNPRHQTLHSPAVAESGPPLAFDRSAG